MGVDLAIYRARIGTFGNSVGVDIVTVVCYVNFDGGLKTVGSVFFIGILLLIAGIESNPGPKTEGDKCRSDETQTLQCKLKVTDLPHDVDEEMLKTFFEQTDDLDGGKVTSVTLDRNRNIAFIEFEDSEAVETVLRKQPIIIHEKQVAVESLEDHDGRPTTIMVSDLPDNVDEDILEMFFENTKKQGGGPVKRVMIDKQKKVATVEFEDPEAVENVLAKQPVTIFGKEVHVTVNQQGAETGAQLTTIKVSGLPDYANEESLEMFFENTKKQGGGPIKKVTVDKQRKLAFIEFKEPGAVETVMAKRPISFLGRQLEIEKQDTMTVEQRTTIKVSGVSDHVDEDTLEMFFENTKKQGGGPVRKVSIDRQRKVAFIEFEEPGAVEIVLAKQPITLFGMQTKIEIPGEETVEQPTTIKVSGIPKHVDEESLEMFFENTKKQGGGPVRKVTIHKQKQVAFIEFKEPGAVETVLSKQPIVLFGSRVKVDIKGEETVEQPTTIKVIGIPEHADEESLEMFFENTKKHGGGPVKKVTIDRKNNVAFIEFEETGAVETILKRLPISIFGQRVRIELMDEDIVEKPRTIKVSGLPEHADEESLELFFENTKKYGGGPVRKVTVDIQKKVAFIEFEDSGVVENILAHQPITIFGTQVKLEIQGMGTVKQPSTIKISGLPEHANDEILELFFENTKKQGGGPVRKVTVDKHKKVAYVEFEEPEAVNTVLAKRPITILGTQVMVEVLDLKTVDQPTTIKVSDIPEHLDEESLEMFFENTKKQGGGPVRKVTLDKQKKVALIEFQEPEAVSIVLNKRPIRISGQQVTVDILHEASVDETTRVQATGLPKGVTTRMLRDIFEDTEQGGGPVKEVIISERNNAALVEFQNPEAATAILNKRYLTVLGEKVKVSEFKDSVHFLNDSPDLTPKPELHTSKANVDSEVDEKAKHKQEGIKKWMHNLELKRYAERKLTVEDTLAIDLSARQEGACHKLRKLPVFFLKQLLSANSECMDLRIYNLDQPKECTESQNLGSVQAMLRKSNDAEMISPLDLLLISFQSCDLELRQLLCQKLYLCKLAVPLLFHDIYLGKDLLSIWPLHSVVIENKFSQENPGPSLTEIEALHMSTKTVAFARFGRPSCSKSKLLNGVLCNFNSDTFFHKECQSGLTTRHCTDGYVEMFWLPTIGEKISRFKDPITFFNLRGNILNPFFEKHETLIVSLSDIFVLFLDIKSILEFENQIKSVLMKHQNNIVVISNPIDFTNKDTVNVLMTFEASVKLKCQTLHILCTYSGLTEKTQVDVCMEITDIIRDVLPHVNPNFCTLYSKVKAFPEYQALTDENDMCMSARETAQSVLEMMKSISPQEHWSSKVTPVQYIYSRQLGKLLKEMCSKKEQHECLQMKKKIEETRKSQIFVTEPVKMFTHHLTEFSFIPSKLHLYLVWLRIFLEEEKKKTALEMDRRHQDLWNKYNVLKRQENPNALEIKKYEELIQKSEIEIEEASFGIANFFREISHIYDAIIHLTCDPRSIDLPALDVISKVFALFILTGHTFELLDGNSLFMPVKWNKAILGYVHKQIALKKVLAFSVLGLQSSGKSTLLNTMFGVQFTASSGRCTRGIHAQLIPVKQANEKVVDRFDYVLVIDTEGLRAPELKDTNYKRDNELATIITGLGDITMLNVMGENTAEIRDVLQIIVHAFLRLNLANPKVDIRKKCVFIHQNVSDVSASEKMKAGLQLSVEILDKVTKESAESEGISNINTFDQVIAFRQDTDVWYLPNLWKGNPPMAQVNRKYSEKVVDISHKLVQTSLNDDNKSFKSLEDIVDYTRDLWEGVLAENFLFSFRNSVEKKAYIALENKLRSEFWRTETSVDDKLYEICREKFSKCETNAILQKEKDSINIEIHNFVAEKEAAMSECLEEFFEKNDYKDTTIQWKEQTLNQVKRFTTGIIHKKEPEIESLYQRRAFDIFTKSINAKNEEELRKKSADVAKQLKGQNLSDEQIDLEFEKIWKSFVKDSLASMNTESQNTSLHHLFIQRLDTIFAHHQAVLYSVLNQHSMFEKRLNIKCLSKSFHLTGVTEEDLSLKSTFYKWAAKLSLSDKAQKAHELARDNLEEVFCIADEMIEKYKQKDQDLTDKDVGSFLRNIYQTICNTFEKDSLPFTAKKTLYVKTMVHISNVTCTSFEEHNHAYQLRYGVKAKLQKYKVQCRDRLYAHLKDRKKEETAAILFRHEFVTYICETVLDGMSKDSKFKLIPSMPSNKYVLIVDILTDLTNKNDFHDFLQYIKHPQSFAEYWVTKKIRDILFGSSPSLYSSIAESNMMLYVNDLKHVINNSDTAFNDPPSIDEWIKYFCKELQYCKFPPESFKEVRKEFDQTCHVNVENFKSSLLEQIMQVEKDLKLEFFPVTAATVKWRAFDPCDDIFNELWGCGEECKFCGEPCKHEKDHAVDHECLQHRPGGLIGIRSRRTNKVDIDTCDFNIASGAKASCGIYKYKCNEESKQPCSSGSHPYSDYKKYFPKWDIKPGTDVVEQSKFWFWFMAKYKNMLKERYSYDIWNIPDEWSSISAEDALCSLRKLYSYQISSDKLC